MSKDENTHHYHRTIFDHEDIYADELVLDLYTNTEHPNKWDCEQTSYKGVTEVKVITKHFNNKEDAVKYYHERIGMIATGNLEYRHGAYFKQNSYSIRWCGSPDVTPDRNHLEE